MDISEVRVKLVSNPKERLKAFCSITLDNDFVIRDLKVIDGSNGTFVAMPSRKLADKCPNCSHKNHLRARFCNECGKKLHDSRRARNGRNKLHADIAHPINAACRERIQNIVVDAYQEELEKSQQPGYMPVDLDEDYDSYDDDLAEAGVDTGRATSKKDSSSSSDGAVGSGYDDLIADLKRDAANRRSSSGSRARGAVGATVATSDSFDTGDDETMDEAVSQVGSGGPAAVATGDVERARTPESQGSEDAPKDDFGAGL